MAESQIPDLAYFIHIPNSGFNIGGRAGSEGQRFAMKQRAILRTLGVKKGVSDFFWPVRRGKYHGLRIELKSQKGRPTPEQKLCFDEMQRQGYATSIRRGCDAAIKCILEYNKQGGIMSEDITYPEEQKLAGIYRALNALSKEINEIKGVLGAIRPGWPNVCPKCGTSLTVATSHMISDKVRRRYYHCTKCDYRPSRAYYDDA